MTIPVNLVCQMRNATTKIVAFYLDHYNGVAMVTVNNRDLITQFTKVM